MVLESIQTGLQHSCWCAETWAFLEPFSWQLWLALTMTAFGVAIIMVIAGKLSPLGTFDMRAIRRLDVSSSSPQEFVVSNSRLPVAALSRCMLGITVGADLIFSSVTHRMLFVKRIIAATSGYTRPALVAARVPGCLMSS